MLSVFQKRKIRKIIDAVSLGLAAFALVAISQPLWPEISFFFEKPRTVMVEKTASGSVVRNTGILPVALLRGEPPISDSSKSTLEQQGLPLNGQEGGKGEISAASQKQNAKG
ncbi:MAG TPA: hypothetical protein VEA59_05805, partial [Patescibacteria group bacterium]|nr:hypothetical protein [Patescibacteria group bacterium]